MRWGWLLVLGLATASSAAETGRRSPVAVVVDGPWVYAANRDAGSIVVIDAATRRLVREEVVGASMVDLAVAPGGRLLAVDAGANQLLVLRRDQARLVVHNRLAVAADPIGVCVAPDGTFAAVASRWSRRVTIVELGEAPRVAREVRLAFNPRRLIAVGAPARLVVADAFGGGLAVVDPAKGVVESSRSIAAHNIGGLTLDRDGGRLLLTQQYLNARAHTAADDIHWGFLMTNSVRSIRLDLLLRPEEDVVPGGRLDHLGEPGRGAGDPMGLATLPDGRVVVALGGVGEVAVGTVEHPDRMRVKVGGRPVAVAVDAAGRFAYAADAVGDAIVAVDLDRGEVVGAPIVVGPGVAGDPVAEGERLFHDAALSHEGWMSCRSCHADGHASGFRADTLGDGAYGAPKRTLSLLGLADTAPYAWDGRMPDLEEQVRKSFQTTLRADRMPTAAQVDALAAYLQTLRPAPGDAPDGDPAQVERGRLVFEKQRCDRCHAAPSYTSAKTYDVGLEDESGNGLFNPPSLRGVSQRDRLLHDGRARGLEEVFRRFRHPAEADIPAADVDDLIAFLRTL